MGAVACLRRFMEQCLDEYRDDFVIPYLTDLLIFPSFIRRTSTTSKIGFSEIETV